MLVPMGPPLVLSQHNLIASGEDISTSSTSISENQTSQRVGSFTFLWKKIPVFKKIRVYGHNST
jgi:hypothetical protein